MNIIKEKPEDFVVEEVSDIELLKRGDYSIFLLKKINYTTERAIQNIADNKGLARKLFGYAGNKDKIAVTTQFISIKGDFNNLTCGLKDIELKFKGYSDSPISLGNLKGNNFKILVKTKQKPKKIKRFINYFGEQRFSRNNKEIGKALIKKDFKNAIELILENKGRQENAVADYLLVNKTDYIGALRKLPIKTLQIYIHSYQSYLWNKMVEKNIKSKKDMNMLPIIGFDTIHTKEIDETLDKEGVSTRDFIIKQIPELTFEGSYRKIYCDLEKLNMKKENNSYILNFFLKKGSYATEAIKQLFS